MEDFWAEGQPKKRIRIAFTLKMSSFLNNGRKYLAALSDS